MQGALGGNLQGAWHGGSLQGALGESLQGTLGGALCKVHWGGQFVAALPTHTVSGGGDRTRNPHVHAMLSTPQHPVPAQHPADGAMLAPLLQHWPNTLQSQPSRSTDTNRTWGRTAGSGPAALLNAVSRGRAAPTARGAWGGLIHPRRSCRCRWTCSCTRRTAAAPHRPWPRNSWARRSCRSTWRPEASGPTRSSLPLPGRQ